MIKGCEPVIFVLFFVVTTYSPQQCNAAASKQEATKSTRQGMTVKPRANKSVVYINKQYGFSFSLPKSWKGYSIVVGKWGGGTTSEDEQAKTTKLEGGPLISIRHPLWTEANPRQDIPIMVLTHAQWDLVEEGQLIVSAAPILPAEIGRNAKFVFAIPPRFEYAFPTGWEEVVELLQHHPRACPRFS